MELSEPIIEAITTRLDSELGDVIDSINAEVEDGYQLDPPFEVLDYVPPLRLMTNFPLVCVADGGSRFEDDTSWSATGVHKFIVVVFIEDLDQRGLARKLRRYSKALATVVLRDRNLAPVAWGVTLDRIEPGPTLGRRQGPNTRLSWVAVSFTAKTDENAT